jgi:dienelactone hydrolase
MRFARLLLAAWMACCAALSPAPARAQGAVVVPPGTWSTSPSPMPAHLYLPPGAGPHPAVVLLHGCGGAYARSGAIGTRHAMWGRWLADNGYAALLLDSFSSRGLRELCTAPMAQRTLKESDRVGDAHAALAWLRQRADIQPQRVALMGWSHGGGVTLDAMARAPESMPGFRAGVAFYPGCTSRLRQGARYRPYAPLLLVVGQADDWTPAAPCEALAANAASRGLPVQILAFSDTYHDFDNPALKAPRVRADVPNGARPGQGVTTAPNPEAAEQARRRVVEHLQTHMP